MGFALLIGVVLVSVAFLATVGGVVSLVVLWPRLRTLERRMTQLEALSAEPSREPAPARAPGPRLEPGPLYAPPVPAPAAVPRSAPVSATPVAPVPVSRPETLPAPPPRRPEPEPPRPTTAPVSTPSWEDAVGANWLNRLGVLITVIGIALAVSYSFTRIGPGGRVALGFVLSLSMLAAGVVVSRREALRTYGHGLVAGGWAGTYFTTYAMHAVPAARILDDVVVATAALLAVSVAMFAHALRYRSQVVAALTLIVVYATLATTPLSWFALLSAVPVAAAVLAIAAWRHWPGLSTLSIAATYGIAILRGASAPIAGEPSIAPFLLLATYWITFELADLLALERAPDDTPVGDRQFALNAIGLAGSTLLVVPPADERLPWFLTAMAVAYVASALARRRREQAGATARGDAGTADGPSTFHAAVAMALCLMLWATGNRFDGARQATSWLVMAELVAVAGLVLRDAWLRVIGLGGIGLAAIAALNLIGRRLPDVAWPLPLEHATPVLLLVATAVFLNREWLGRLSRPGFRLERGFTAVGSLLIATAIATEVSTIRTGALWIVLGAVLIERGLRNDRAYRIQGYVAGVLGAWLLLTVFGTNPETIGTRETWLTLGAGTAILWAIAGRLAVWSPGELAREALLAAGAACVMGTALGATFEWRLLPAAWVGLGWTLSGYLLLRIGLGTELLRVLGYMLMCGGAMRVVALLGGSALATTTDIATATATLALVTAVPVVDRLLRHSAGSGEPTSTDEIAHALLPAVGTLLLAWLVADEARPSQVTLYWGLIGTALFGLGFPARVRPLRVAGLAMLAACVLKLFLYDLNELDAVPRILSFVVLGLVLLGVSWIYTRRRPPAAS